MTHPMRTGVRPVPPSSRTTRSTAVVGLEWSCIIWPSVQQLLSSFASGPRPEPPRRRGPRAPLPPRRRPPQARARPY
ncbi:MAG: hypothetical protein ACK559_31580, partial [bacterium]